MIRFASLIAIAILTSAAHAASYNLRGPGPKVGDTVRSETVTVMADGTMNIDAGAFKLAGKTSRTARSVTEVTVLEMNEGSVTKVRVHIVADTQDQMVEVMGKRNNTKIVGPLDGQVVVGTLKDGTWTFALESDSPTAEQKAHLLDMASEYRFVDKASMVYPDREIQIGESWDVDASDLHSHFVGAHRPEGKVTYTLDKVEELDGEQVAHLTVVMDLSTKMTDQGEGTLTMKGKGPLVRSLVTYLDTKSELSGTMEMQMSEDNVSMTMNGPMTVTATEARQ